MTPFRMRLLVVAFLAIATAISINALYFQDGRRLAASTIGSGQSKTAGENAANTAARVRAGVTAALPDKRGPAPRAQPQEPSPQPPAGNTPPPPPMAKQAELQATPLVRAIQKKLAHFGYRSIPQDGLPNRDTRAAILAVQFEQGLLLTGEPTDSVLAALYFLEASGRGKLASSERFERDPKLVVQVQDLLAKLGYSSGPVDGQFDAKTREALKKFEADRRLKAGGRLTERILIEMVIESGNPFTSKS